ARPRAGGALHAGGSAAVASPPALTLSFGSSAGALEHRDFLAQPWPEAVAFHLEVVAHLEVQPELVARAEVSRQAESRIRGDRSRTVNDLVDPPSRDADLLRQPILRELERLEELLLEDLSGV